MAAVTTCSDFGAPENKICHCFCFSPFCLARSDGTGCHDLRFEYWDSSQLFTILFYPQRDSSVPLQFWSLEWYHLNIWDCWYFSWQSWFQLVIHSIWHFTWCILHITKISEVTIYIFVMVLSKFWTSLLFCVQFHCFLTHMQVSQDIVKLVWYSHLLRIFTVHCDPHGQRI